MKVKLKEACKKFKNWSVYRLAKNLDVVEQTVYHWASGRNEMSYKNVEKICNLLECDIVDILEVER